MGLDELFETRIVSMVPIFFFTLGSRFDLFDPMGNEQVFVFLGDMIIDFGEAPLISICARDLKV